MSCGGHCYTLVVVIGWLHKLEVNVQYTCVFNRSALASIDTQQYIYTLQGKSTLYFILFVCYIASLEKKTKKNKRQLNLYLFGYILLNFKYSIQTTVKRWSLNKAIVRMECVDLLNLLTVQPPFKLKKNDCLNQFLSGVIYYFNKIMFAANQQTHVVNKRICRGKKTHFRTHHRLPRIAPNS